MAAARAIGRFAGLFRGTAAGSKERGHVLIAGTGRAGTTLLVRICARLGLDTGFSDDQILLQLDSLALAHPGEGT